jgi:hypothetical protein
MICCFQKWYVFHLKSLSALSVWPPCRLLLTCPLPKVFHHLHECIPPTLDRFLSTRSPLSSPFPSPPCNKITHLVALYSTTMVSFRHCSRARSEFLSDFVRIHTSGMTRRASQDCFHKGWVRWYDEWKLSVFQYDSTQQILYTS